MVIVRLSYKLFKPMKSVYLYALFTYIIKVNTLYIKDIIMDISPHQLVSLSALDSALAGIPSELVWVLIKGFNELYRNDIPTDLDECFEVYVEDNVRGLS